jgi:CYTH domain-containing protein
MATEIERKFIVPLEHQNLFVGRSGGTRQIQAYLSEDPARTVRLRVSESPDSTFARMTVKGRPQQGGISKPEWEWDMPLDMTLDMINTLNPPLLDKTRHEVNYKGNVWEVDVLKVNTVAGRPPQMWRYLVTAEVEAPTVAAARAVPLPPWVGQEVTGDKRYAMSMLLSEAARDAAYRAAYGR